MENYQDQLGNTINLTFYPNEFQDPGHVLILPFYNGKLVFAHHRRRGIELPGGKIESGETPLAAAVREVFEEIGASLTEIKLIGQYIVEMPEGKMVKSIYTAIVDQLLSTSFDTDTFGPIIYDEIPVHVYDNPEFSLYMKDEVYPRTLQFLGLI